MRIVEIQNLNQAKLELEKIGSHPSGIAIMAPKAVFRAVKIKGISATPANIIKQDLLSLGGEAATSAGTITHCEKKTDILLLGTIQQLAALTEKLKSHGFGLPALAEELKTVMENREKKGVLKIGKKRFRLGQRTIIMGVLNITPDSFSDGGKFYSADQAVKQAYKMAEEGADIIDVGGESSRPGSLPIPAREEIKRIIPVIKRINRDLLVSVDTYKSPVAKAALDAGAVMINDISGLHFDKKMAATAAHFEVPVVIMHIKGKPKNMQRKPVYSDLIGEIIAYLKEGLAIAENAGILKDRIIVDPGFGFGKTVQHNLEILRKLKEIKSLGQPILIGTSRKSAIGQILDLPPDQRIEGTIATAVVAIGNGADMLRVHDVAKVKLAAKMADEIVRRS